MSNQTSIIAASLIIAFIVFVTVRGELPGYIGVFNGQGPTCNSGISVTGTSSFSAGAGGGGFKIGINLPDINIPIGGGGLGVQGGGTTLGGFGGF